MFTKYKWYTLMLLPGALFFIVYKIVPLFGLSIAFLEYYPWIPLTQSGFIGFANFRRLFGSNTFTILLRNTLWINFLKLLFGIPLPVIMALMINSLRGKIFKRGVQTVTYMPQFLSWIIVFGFAYSMFNFTYGKFNELLESLFGTKIAFLAEKSWFVPIVILTYLWKNAGWGSVVYIATLSNISPDFYEAADIEGANAFQKIMYITLPFLLPIIIVISLMQLGNMLFGDFEQILLFLGSNWTMYSKGDIFETFVYRIGVMEGEYSFATAVSIFQGLFGILLVFFSNFLMKKSGHEGIW